jgi:hypothetical protein
MMRYTGLGLVVWGSMILAMLAWAWLVGPADAQPSYNQQSIPYCPTGVFDAQGNPIVTPCGGVNVPGLIVQETQHANQPYLTQQCPPNPISKKVPPLC